MVAVAHPSPSNGPRQRPHLVAVPSGSLAPRRPASPYRRRRLIALLLVAAVTVAGYAGLKGAVGSLAPDPTVPASPGPRTGGAAATHVVRPGDTLWAIAEDIAAGRDVRVVVDALAEAHGSAELQVGEVVQIPAELLP